MAVLPDYVTGTITLANGSATVTGTGTMFTTAAFRPGDTLQIQNMTAVIASVDNNTKLTLAEPWTGTNLTNAPYRARYLPDGARVTAQTTTLIELLGNGVLTNLAELGVEEGKAPVGNAAGQYELKAVPTDPNGSLGKLAALTLAANKILNTDTSGNLAQSDITAAALALLNLAGAAAADRLPYLTGANGAALTTLTSFARTILDDSNGAAMWSTMGATTVAGNPGYLVFPNGLKLQWGNQALTASSGVCTVAYPTSFTTFAIPVFVNGDTNAYTYTPMGYRSGVVNQFTTYFPGGASATVRITWIAIGV